MIQQAPNFESASPAEGEVAAVSPTERTAPQLVVEDSRNRQNITVSHPDAPGLRTTVTILRHQGRLSEIEIGGRDFPIFGIAPGECGWCINCAISVYGGRLFLEECSSFADALRPFLPKLVEYLDMLSHMLPLDEIPDISTQPLEVRSRLRKFHHETAEDALRQYFPSAESLRTVASNAFRPILKTLALIFLEAEMQEKQEREDAARHKARKKLFDKVPEGVILMDEKGMIGLLENRKQGRTKRRVRILFIPDADYCPPESFDKHAILGWRLATAQEIATAKLEGLSGHAKIAAIALAKTQIETYPRLATLD